MTKDWWFPTAFSHWGEEEHAVMARVIQSNRYTMGPETEAFEAEIAAFNQRKHAVACNSGSSANLLAVAALQDGTLGVASVPALAWATTYSPLIQYQIDALQLVDCDDSWCADYLAPNTHGVDPDIVVTCSILGNPGHLEGADHADFIVLNDDCEAFGATIGGRPTASFGTIATQSFFWSHQLSAIEGGVALTDDDRLAQVMRMVRDHGMTRSIQKASKFEEEYDFRVFGYNLRPVEMNMAIARAQLEKAHMHKAARRRNWARFADAVKDLPIKLPAMHEGASPFSLHFEVPQSHRRAIVENLRHNNIDCRLPTGGSFRLHEYGKPWADQQTPRADEIHRCGLFLGNAPYDIEDKIAKAVQVLKEVLSWRPI